MPWGDIVQVGGFLLALAAFAASLYATRKKEATADRLSAIDGFDKLTKGQSLALAECEEKLRKARAELQEVEEHSHKQDDEIHAQAVRIRDLTDEVATLKRHVAVLEGKAP